MGWVAFHGRIMAAGTRSVGGAVAVVAASLSLALAGAAGAAPAAGSAPAPPVASPAIAAEPAIAITLVPCDSAHCSTVRIGNTGKATLKIISVTGYDVFVAAECTTHVLAPGRFCEVTVGSSPLPTTSPQYLEIVHNARGGVTDIAYWNPSRSWIKARTSACGARCRTVTLQSTGLGPLQVGRVNARGATLPPAACLKARITPGGTCTFRATLPAGRAPASLTVASNAPVTSLQVKLR